ncbi:MFS transporter [Kitasatospora kazusensis]|uniref:MFS transporter n=1 Tax=Kitasatospora kazusensis TaxID=407974 RepID=A0ABN2ZLW1_9ACTN
MVWTSVTVSSLGDGMRFVALPLLAARVSGDPRQVALVALVEQLPWLLLGLPAGALADRLDRRRMLWTVDAARTVLVGALAVTVALDATSVALLAVAGFLLGCGQTLYNGAWSGIVPALVEPGDRIRANSRIQAGALITDTLIGTPLGTLLFAVAAAAPFAVDTASFAVAALLVAFLPGDFRPAVSSSAVSSSGASTLGLPAAPARSTLRRDMAEGVRWLWRHRLLRRLCAVSAASNLVGAGLIAILVLYAREALGLRPFGFGLLVAAFAVGGLAGTALTQALAARLGTGRTLRLAVLVSAVAAVGAGTAHSGVAAGCFIAAYGSASLIWNTTAVSLRQSLVPAELLGRVGMAYQMASNGAGALGAAVSGLLAHSFGLRAPFLAGAALLLLAALASGRLGPAAPATRTA